MSAEASIGHDLSPDNSPFRCISLSMLATQLTGAQAVITAC